MNIYPDSVNQIANDYLWRIKAKLRGVPSREQDEFLREIESHLYEAYRQRSDEDEVARILAVLRNLGEPSDVVSDRLPRAMVRSGSKRNLPLYILGGIVVALFGVPLGFSGVGVLIGILATLAGLIFAYYAISSVSLLTGGLFLFLGIARISMPGIWDRLVAAGLISMGESDNLFNQLPLVVQGVLMIIIASVLIALGVGMLWLGKYMLRGLRFMAVLTFEWIRQLAQTIRKKWHERSATLLPSVATAIE